MGINPEQESFKFEPQKHDAVEVPVEAPEDKECIACGNLLASESKGCSECSDNKIKLKWQKENERGIPQ